ncbi:fructose-1,6-bisphosphatase, partial [Ancylostoma ceylanicum]
MMTRYGEFIMEKQADFPFASGELSRLLYDIVFASKVVSRDVRKAGLVDHILGAQGNTNIQGEEQQKLDVVADEQFIQVFKKGAEVCGIASEENDDFVVFDDETGRNGKRKSEVGTVAVEEDFLQPGHEQIAAGYVLYGSSTMLVYTTGRGVNGFTLDPSIGEFCLSHPNMKMPETGRIYAMNEGNIHICNPGIKKYVEYCQSSENQTGKPYSGRYIGSLVADFHRNLIKGGIYIYPSTTNDPEGKLRLMYECNPLAFISEQAGGLASTGFERILSIQPEHLHQRFLESYLNNASPTGFESEGQKLWLEYLKPYIDTYFSDNYGTVVGVINPEAAYKVVIEAHADEISWFVHYITKEGFIYLKRNGGSDHMIAPSKRVNIHTDKGIVKGIFGWPAIHTRHTKDEAPSLKNIFLDVACSTKEEVEALGIHVGCVVTFEDEFFVMNSNRFVGRALDNRIGGFMIAEVARLLKESKTTLPFGLYIVNSVQEEIGLRGAEMISRKIKPNVAICTDVCHDTHTPMIDKIENGDFKSGDGPPGSVEEVSQILAYCNTNKLPVTPMGARTGLSGGAIPFPGGIALSMERFNRILTIDERNHQVITEPGVITQVLQEAVKERGLFYPPDPASKGSCFIGGNISENSGGPKAVKYGVTKDYVLNLEVVLADGSILWTGANVLKNATGYNLTQLMVGSEGTLAVITKIVLKLLPHPTSDLLMLVPFYSAKQACEAVAAIYRKGIIPSGLEFMERDALIWTQQFTGDFSLE